MKTCLLKLVVGALVLGSPVAMVAGDGHGHEHEHGHMEARHGGVMLEVGDHAAHLEVLYDEKHGVVKAWLSNHDGDKPIAGATLKLNVRFKSGHKSVTLAAVEDHPGAYMAESADLKGHFVKARFNIKIGDKTYLVDFEHDHDHEHDDHDHGHDEHEGHNH